MRTTRKLAAGGLAALAVLGGASVATGALTEDRTASVAGQLDPSRPKNVILLAGDGMGDSEVTLARFYGKGAGGRLAMDALPFRGSSLHVTLHPGPGPSYAPNYVGDSAATATAFSTGKRTIDGRLSQGPSSAESVPGSNAGYRTYLEIARDRGKATGNVTTAELTDATPAAPSAHISHRTCQGPQDTRTSCPSEARTASPPGLGSIAEQQIGQGFDVLLGGGRGRFRQPLVEGGTEDVLGMAQAAGYTLVQNRQQLTAVEGGKVLGLFHEGGLSTHLRSLYARTEAFYQANPDRDVQTQGGSATTRCRVRDRADEPSLAEMTRKAIELLRRDPDGFVLQVEGAAIDKRNHLADVCGQIGETLGLDDAVAVALEFQREHPDTLVVVTADHAHTSQMTYVFGKPATGTSYATLQTADGAPIRVSYGTADTGAAATTSGSQHHTGAQVPVWAIGPQAANVQGTIDQTDIFSILNGLTPSRLAAGEQGPARPAGAAGPAGATGTKAPSGVTGPPGAIGAQSPSGPVGATGEHGDARTQSPAGPQGPAGAQGPAGRTTVACRSVARSAIRCEVRPRPAGLRRARLVLAGRTVARGTVRAGSLLLRARRPLPRGRYVVVVDAAPVRIRLR